MANISPTLIPGRVWHGTSKSRSALLRASNKSTRAITKSTCDGLHQAPGSLVSLTPVPISPRLSSCHVWKYLKAHRQRHKNSDFYSGPVRSVKRLESHFMFWVETVKSETWHDVSQSAPLGSYIPSYLCIPDLARVKIRKARPLLNWKQGLFCSYHVMTSSRVSRCHGSVKMSYVMTLFVLKLKHDWQRCHVVIKMEWHCNMFSGNNWQEKHLSQKASIKHSLSQWSDTTVLDYVAVSMYLMTINTHTYIKSSKVIQFVMQGWR